MDLEFAWPWLFAALPLPALIAYLVPPARPRESMALRVPFYAQMQSSFTVVNQQRSKWITLFAMLAWVLLVIAAARPQSLGETLHIPQSGRSLMLAVDISGSMQTEDMIINNDVVMRLTAVKYVAGDFMQQRIGDRLGLILFGDEAYLQAPLSFDRATVQTLLNEAVIGLAGQKTAIGDAIGLAVKRLREQVADNRVLILLTDGANTAGTIKPLKAADLAANESVKIYTIGIGAESTIVRGFLGGRRVANREIDEDTLRAISEKTGGKYFRALDTQSLQDIYKVLDQIEPLSEDEQSYRLIEELYVWPLGGAFILSLLLVLVNSVRFKFGHNNG